MLSFDINPNEIVWTVDKVLHEHDVTADRDIYVPGDEVELAVLVALWGEFARPDILAIERNIRERVDPDAVDPGDRHLAIQVANRLAIQPDGWSAIHGFDENAGRVD